MQTSKKYRRGNPQRSVKRRFISGRPQVAPTQNNLYTAQKRTNASFMCRGKQCSPAFCCILNNFVPPRNPSAVFFYFSFKASESVLQPSIAHFTLAGICEISLRADASSRLSISSSDASPFIILMKISAYSKAFSLL